MKSTRTRSVVIGLAVVSLAASTFFVANPAVAAAPTLGSSAKAKCVNVKTGFARYSRQGACRKGERKDRKPCAKGGTCVVGDTGPGGGKIYYSARRKQAWGRYLEVAPRTWNGSTGDLNVNWCSNVVDSIPGTQATGLGAGKANTAAMLAVCTSDAPVTASGYRGGGKSDWYLPSRDELRALFLRQRVVGGFQLHGYWSSSESSPNEAWIQDFYSDYQPAPSDKGFANFVRPIRSF
jgi:hypothetical protein